MPIAAVLAALFVLFWIVHSAAELGGPLLAALIIVGLIGAFWLIAKTQTHDAGRQLKQFQNEIQRRRSNFNTKPTLINSSLVKSNHYEMITSSVNDFAQLVPDSLLMRSGSVFYSGRSAFSVPSSLYILGLNPGGSPLQQATETISRDLDEWKNLPAEWSAYADESWEGKLPGTHGMQPRVLHLFKKIGMDIRKVPASNVVFVRTRSEAALKSEKSSLLDLCWPIHNAVIRDLNIQTVLCFGDTAAQWVREQVGADRLVGVFREHNDRGWQSAAHISAKGLCVIKVSHPGRADWRNPAADPSSLVKDMLNR